MKTIFVGLVVALGLGWVLFRDELEKEPTKFDSSYIFPYNPAPPFIMPSITFGKRDTNALLPLEVNGMATGDYSILYRGRYKDSIVAYQDPENKESIFPNKKYDLENYTLFKNGKRSFNSSGPIPFNLSIVVDTSTIISYEPTFIHSDKLFQSHPVYLINIYTCAVEIVTRPGSFYLILEAQNEKGIWKPIESHLLGDGGVFYTVLLPGEIAATTVPVFKGSFKTKMRIKLPGVGFTPRHIYSNEFEGSIHLSQFKERY